MKFSKQNKNFSCKTVKKGAPGGKRCFIWHSQNPGHGIRFRDANVTNNHPILTGMIVLAHLKESLDYYKLLEVAELEGDLLKAVAAGNIKKTKTEYKKLVEAKIALAKAEAARIS
jgi:hypothetical protein